MALTDKFDADKHLREKIPAFLGPNAAVKFISDKDVTVTHISFYNQGASALTSAATVKNGADTIASSSGTLSSDTAEEKEGTDLNSTYKLVSDGATVTITAGDQPMYIVVTIESLQE